MEGVSSAVMKIQRDSSLFGPGGLEAESSSPRASLRTRELDEGEGERALSRAAPGIELYGESVTIDVRFLLLS